MIRLWKFPFVITRTKPPESLSPRLSSVESLRSSIPEEHRKLFDSLQQDIKDYCEAHGLPAPSLTSREAFITAARKNRTPPDVLNHIILLLTRFDYLTEHKKPMPETADMAEVLEYAEKHYHLSEQYNQQVSLLREVGILDELDEIKAIDGHSYPIPTLEQIAERIFERREELSSKHDQGFTKLLLVPFGMSLDTLLDTLKHFLLAYKKKHPDFELDTDKPLWVWDGYTRADTATNLDGSPVLVYHPTSPNLRGRQGKTKAQILLEQSKNPSSFPGWTIHLLQPSNPKDPNSPGIAHIPRQGQGTSYGQDTPNPLDPSTPCRSDLEAGKPHSEYLSLLQSSHDNPDSPYHLETSLTPEDWIIASMTHLQETGQPLDNYTTGTQSICFLTGAFFPSFSMASVPNAYWDRGRRTVFDKDDIGFVYSEGGSRSSVMI
jgi:hypothetical protein